MKFIITGMHSSRKHEFMYYLEKSLPEYFKVGRVISNNPYYKKNPKHRYFSDKEIQQIYDNQGFIFLWNGYGLTKDIFEENNLFTLSIEDFLMVPNRYYNRNDILIIWLDSSKEEREINHLIFGKLYSLEDTEAQQTELIQQFVQALAGKKVMYFKNESCIEMLSKVLQYIEEPDVKKRQKLLEDEF